VPTYSILLGMQRGAIRSVATLPRTRTMRLRSLSALAIAALILVSAAVTEAGTSKPASPVITGSVAGVGWQLRVFRLPQKSPDRPCLSVTLEYSGKGTLCGEFTPIPLITAAELNRGTEKRFVVGMVFDPKVARAKVWFRGREPRVVQLRLLPEGQARRVGLVSLRYGATAFSGRSCLMRVSGFDRSGQLVKPSVKIPCG
jgi:hypothetical protein